MAYRRKPAPPRGRVVILPGTPRPEDLALVSGMTLDELVRDIVNDRTGKYERVLAKQPETAADAAGE